MKDSTAERLSKAIVMALFTSLSVSLAIVLTTGSSISWGTILAIFVGLAGIAVLVFLMTVVTRPILERFLISVPKSPWFRAPRMEGDRPGDSLLLRTAKAIVGASFQ